MYIDDVVMVYVFVMEVFEVYGWYICLLDVVYFGDIMSMFKIKYLKL